MKSLNRLRLYFLARHSAKQLWVCSVLIKNGIDVTRDFAITYFASHEIFKYNSVFLFRQNLKGSKLEWNALNNLKYV